MNKSLQLWFEKLPLHETNFADGYYILGPVKASNSGNFLIYFKYSQIYITCLLQIKSDHNFEIANNDLEKFLDPNKYIQNKISLPLNYVDQMDCGVYFARVQSLIQSTTQYIESNDIEGFQKYRP